MPQSLDSYLGIHQPALHLQSRRAEILAANLANLDTPNYKARDFDFTAALRDSQATAPMPGALRVTHRKHLQLADKNTGYELAYRQPFQSSADGNTVEHQVELAAYSDNAMRYLATLRFLTGKFNSLRTAIKGQ